MEAMRMLTCESLGDYRNAVVLCPSCHASFDRTPHTRWLFLPTDLDYFLDFERENFETRIQELRRGIRTERTYPNELNYELYMRHTGRIVVPASESCRGGLYDRHILANMFPPIMQEALRARGVNKVLFIFPGGPKRWHGAPMCAINRGFVTTSTIHGLQDGVKDKLQELQRLYARVLPDGVETEDTNLRVDDVSQRTQQTNVNSTSAVGATALLSQSVSSIASDTQMQNDHSRRGDRHCGATEDKNNALGDYYDSDSAIDMTCTALKRKKRSTGANRVRSIGYSTTSREVKKRRRRLSVLGVLPHTWCFGPKSTSTDKARVWIPQPETWVESTPG